MLILSKSIFEPNMGSIKGTTQNKGTTQRDHPKFWFVAENNMEPNNTGNQNK